MQRDRDDTFYAITRGNVLVAVTNSGTGGPTQQLASTYHPYSNNTKLCNL